MRFIVKEGELSTIALGLANTDIVHLRPDNWDDNFKFKTSFVVTFYPKERSREPIILGGIKIIKLHQKEGTWTKDILALDKLLEFDSLPETYCSLGWNEEYYTKLNELLPEEISRYYFKLVNDIYVDPTKAVKFNTPQNPGFSLSLIRDSFAAHLFREAQKKQFPNNFSIKDDPKFEVSIHLDGADNPHKIDFDFTSNNNLPNRIFVLVGKNGVGKTQIMGRLGIKISGFEADQNNESFEKDYISERGIFKNVVAISFSAFDTFEVPSEEKQNFYSYRYWGLRKSKRSLYSTDRLIDRVFTTIRERDDNRQNLFRDQLRKIVPGIDLHNYKFNRKNSNHIKNSASAGQKFLIATLGGLVCSLEENSLLLFDEPETHLHPSLLAMLLIIISDILEKFNSYAIISTHSPIVLQQIPSKYIRVIKRIGNTPHIAPTNIETFGENLTEISSYIFDVTEGEKDFSDILAQLLQENNNNPRLVAELFNNRLGISAMSVLYSLANSDHS